MSAQDLSNGRPVNAAVVGLGQQGSAFVHALRLMPEQFNIVGVADISEQSLARVGNAYEVERRTRNWREYLDDDTVDLMYFGTPGDCHSENLLEALSAGKHVYIEKPAAVSTEDCRKALKLAEQNRLTVMVCMNVRNYWPFPVVKRVVDEGMLGDVFFAQQDYIHDCRYIMMPDSPMFLRSYKEPVDYFSETAVHSLDTLTWLLGPVRRVVSAQKSDGIISQARPGAFLPGDCVSLELEFASPNLIGRSLTLIGYVGTYGNTYYGISLYGNKGTVLPSGIFTSELNPDYFQVHSKDTWVKLEFEELYKKFDITVDQSPVPYTYKKGDPHHVGCHLKLFKALLPAMRERREVEPGLRSNARIIAVLEAGKRALETGQPAVVDYSGLS